MNTDPFRPPAEIDGPPPPWWMVSDKAAALLALTVVAMVFLACIDWSAIRSN